MGKVKIYEIDPSERKRIIGELFEIISDLKTKKEIVQFLLGLLSRSELLMIARRIQIAKMLLNENTYEDIRSNMGVGFHTISKTEEWLHSEDKNRDVWIRKQLQLNQKEKKQYVRNDDYYMSMLDKYPFHKIWKDLFK